MSTDFWRQLQLKLDPWDAAYEPPVHLHEDAEASAKVVDATIETPDWRAIRPDPATELPDRVFFIDGCRRIDARLVGRSGHEVIYGAFATIAAGVVMVDRTLGAATFLEPKVTRVLAFGGDHQAPPTVIPCPLGGQDALRYETCLTHVENTPDTPRMVVQDAMLRQEADLADALLASRGGFVVRDGSLRYGMSKSVVGYVKTLHRTYLPPDKGQLLWELACGERTPMFAIGEPGYNERRWSWYLRSGTPADSPEKLGYHGLHGLVRLELPSEVDLEEARRIADATAILIPQYASRSYRDPRAPQNLTPVGALEKELGRRMGDPALIARRVGHFIAQQSSR